MKKFRITIQWYSTHKEEIVAKDEYEASDYGYKRLHELTKDIEYASNEDINVEELTE